MSWQSVVFFALLLSAVVVGPKMGADPQMLGAFTTTLAAFFVKTNTKDDGHSDHVDNSPPNG